MQDITKPDITAKIIEDGLNFWQIPFSSEQIEKCLIYRDLLLDWNANKMNLTRIVEPAAVGSEHYLDSLSILKYCEIRTNSTLMDVGTGAGFPGLALKIFRPDLQVTLLEATAKKLTFCETVCKTLELDGVNFVHGRAEQFPSALRRSSFDVVTARAVANLNDLIDWCLPYFKHRTGQLIALKGVRGSEELESSSTKIAGLKLKVDLIDADIPGSDHTHTIIRCFKST
jgi:16S rRNA (guanine527-N7)-methyltransferase